MKIESFPLYPEKLLSSLDLQLMDCCEFGMYIRILAASFIQERPCYIKKDDRLLMKISGASAEQWNTCKEIVLKEFKEENGYLYNETLLAIYKKECKESKANKKVQTTTLTQELNYTFEEFWKDYDKKVGSKERLIPKWIKLTHAERELIRAHIPLYKDSKPDKQFRKDPATYLNNKSWNDEIIKYTDNKKKSTDYGDTTKQSKSAI